MGSQHGQILTIFLFWFFFWCGFFLDFIILEKEKRIYHSVLSEAFCITVVFLTSGSYDTSGTQGRESEEHRGESGGGPVLSNIVYTLCTLSGAHHKHHVII